MRKHILPRLRALLVAACATLYTRQTRPAKPKLSLAPDPDYLSTNEDAWLFAPDAHADVVRATLSKDMNCLAESLSDLRETLALIHGETPFPVEATTLTPCSIFHHDDALFDGEPAAPFMPAQEEVNGGEGVFLFDDIPGFEDENSTQHLHAA